MRSYRTYRRDYNIEFFFTYRNVILRYVEYILYFYLVSNQTTTLKWSSNHPQLFENAPILMNVNVCVHPASFPERWTLSRRWSRHPRFNFLSRERPSIRESRAIRLERVRVVRPFEKWVRVCGQAEEKRRANVTAMRNKYVGDVKIVARRTRVTEGRRLTSDGR